MRSTCAAPKPRDRPLRLQAPRTAERCLAPFLLFAGRSWRGDLPRMGSWIAGRALTFVPFVCLGARIAAAIHYLKISRRSLMPRMPSSLRT